MSRIAYVDGFYRRLSEPHIYVEDRGYQFSDGIYEVCLVVDGQYWDEAGHMARLRRSLEGLDIPFQMSSASLKIIMREVLRRNRLRDALVYMQISRGVAPRDHPFPDKPTLPVMVMTVKPYSLAANDALAQKGIKIVTMPDIRWGRVDIKSISLLPNALAKQEAKSKKAYEAWLLKENKITEGSSSNAWIINASGSLVTRPLSNEILGGITRESVLKAVTSLGLKVEERAFTYEEALEAKEAFITSASSLVMPVTHIDDQQIGDGQAGPQTLKLRDAYKQVARPS